jgi:adenylate cyclase
MTIQAAANLDVRPKRLEGTSKILAWFRAISVRQIRLACGLLMFSYIFSHFFNHALGNISFAAMDWWWNIHVGWWRIPVVNDALYLAAFTHMSLGFWALYQRRHFRYTAAEITQLVLGLSIPLLLASHFGAVRVGGWLLGSPPPHYASPLFAYWGVRQYMIAVQFTLLTVVWTHACIGLYFWLRLKPFFKRAAPFLLAVAVLVPPLAAVGAHQGGREVLRLAQDPSWKADNVKFLPPPQRAMIDRITLFYFPIAYVAGLGLVFVARGVRSWCERRRGMITVSYPDRQIRIPKGLSILEGSLRFNVPHASVCGGRARCSTCRVRVVSDRYSLPQPSRRESFVLTRVGAAENPAIRLACQLRPQSDVSIIPVIPPNITVDFVRNRTRVNSGKERYVVSMFVDMRGSTKFAEARLPFDVVFLVNRFLGAASQAVIDAGGQPNQFIGDGMLALFGIDCDPKTASQQALRAAAKVAANVEQMNHQFASDLRQPLDFGIGIHGGEVIIGDIGFKDHVVFTALGDPVNVAARLQDLTKSLETQVVISEEVCDTAGIPADALTRHTVSIRGRDGKMMVRTTEDPTILARLVELWSPSHHSEIVAEPA